MRGTQGDQKSGSPILSQFESAFGKLRDSWEKRYLSAFHQTSFREAPEGLKKAILYSVEAGGKRLRPALALRASQVAGVEEEKAALIATALESIHTYSLVHDDLPAMDNDDLRRGKPTSHKKFGEDTAILVGDALQTMAFELLAAAALNPRAIAYFGAMVGPAGMIGGQYLDIKAAGSNFSAAGAGFSPELAKGGSKAGSQSNLTKELSYLEEMHRKKTGCLIEAAIALPFLAADPEREVGEISQWGRGLGKLFQIVDDILDATAESQDLGKTAGKDMADQKLTYVNLLGVERSKEAADGLHEGLKVEAARLFPDDIFFNTIPTFIFHRGH